METDPQIRHIGLDQEKQELMEDRDQTNYALDNIEEQIQFVRDNLNSDLSETFDEIIMNLETLKNQHAAASQDRDMNIPE